MNEPIVYGLAEPSKPVVYRKSWVLDAYEQQLLSDLQATLNQPPSHRQWEALGAVKALILQREKQMRDRTSFIRRMNRI